MHLILNVAVVQVSGLAKYGVNMEARYHLTSAYNIASITDAGNNILKIKVNRHGEGIIVLLNNKEFRCSYKEYEELLKAFKFMGAFAQLYSLK